MALKSKWFGGNQRCQQCAVVDAKHILGGDSGLHVFLVQEALILLDGGRIERGSWINGVMAPRRPPRCCATSRHATSSIEVTSRKPTTSSARYDRFSRRGHARSRDGDRSPGWRGLPTGKHPAGWPRVRLSGPKLVVITETAQPWSKWADQFVAADPARRAKVPIPNGNTPAIIADLYKRAIGLAGVGGTVIISVGHGVPSDASTDDGRFDLGPAGSFKVGGRNALLVGDPPPSHPSGPLVFQETQVFYADSPPPPSRSRKADDQDSGSHAAKRRLANWQAYDDISAAFKAQRLAAIVMLTCRIAAATGMMRRVAQQWGNAVLGYTRRIVGQEVDGRVRVFLQGDPSGTFYQWPNTTNTPASETFFPISRDSVQVNP